MVSLTVSSSCSSLISRISLGFMDVFPNRRAYASALAAFLDVRPPGDEPAAERHLVSDASQAVTGGSFGDAGQLEQNLARTDDGRPVFRLALALAHAGFQRDRGHRFVREHA